MKDLPTIALGCGALAFAAFGIVAGVGAQNAPGLGTASFVAGVSSLLSLSD